MDSSRRSFPSFPKNNIFYLPVTHLPQVVWLDLSLLRIFFTPFTLLVWYFRIVTQRSQLSISAFLSLSISNLADTFRRQFFFIFVLLVVAVFRASIREFLFHLRSAMRLCVRL